MCPKLQLEAEAEEQRVGSKQREDEQEEKLKERRSLVEKVKEELDAAVKQAARPLIHEQEENQEAAKALESEIDQLRCAVLPRPSWPSLQATHCTGSAFTKL